MTDTRPSNPYAQAYADFLEQAKDHRLVVLHMDGLYRHLRVQAPGTRMWSWDINTWPGYLASSGDIADGLVFTRLDDMIDFFDITGGSRDYYSDGAPSIDVRYWAEKLCGGRSHDVKSYDSDRFLKLVREHLKEHEELGDAAQRAHELRLALLKRIHQMRGLDEVTSQALLDAHWFTESRSARHADHAYTTVAQQYRDAASVASLRLWCTDGLTEDQIDELIQKHCFSALSDTSISEQSPAERRATIIDSARLHAGTENGAHTWLSEHEELVGCDTWEWDLRDWNIHFLFACYAIDLTVQLYRQHQAAMESSEHDPDVAAQVNKRLRELADATKQHQRAGSESETAA